VVISPSRARGGEALADWLRVVVARHSAPFSRQEFLKAVRALSSRYVEGRATLTSRSPLDSAGKRAAFAGFYAPLHYLTTRAIVAALPPAGHVRRIVDLGAGTGVAALAWATSLSPPAPVTGIDLNAWALDEMRWNCRTLGVTCRTKRESLIAVLDRELAGNRIRMLANTGIVCGWSLNELTAPERAHALDGLLAARRNGAVVLVIEPLARSAVPWWETWQRSAAAVGGRADEWRIAAELPRDLAEIDEQAGFRREHLTARSLWLGPG
jgi:hypothetical protein